MRVLVFGGSGQIGQFLLPRLCAAGDEVHAYSRQARDEAGDVHWHRGGFADMCLPDGPAFDVVYNAGPLREFMAWLERTSLAGAPRLVSMSSMSVLSKRASPDPAESAMVADMVAAERGLAERCARQGWGWMLLRCTLVYGCGRDKSLTPLVQQAARWRVFPVPQGRGLRQPVHADDLAQALFAAGRLVPSPDRIVELGGGERLSAAAMFARARRGLPVWTWPLPIPHALLGVLARAMPSRSAMLGRLDRDLVVDNSEAEQLLGVRPRDFAPRWPGSGDVAGSTRIQK